MIQLLTKLIGCDAPPAPALTLTVRQENFNKKNKIILFRIYIYECMSGTSMEKSQIRFQINEKGEATIK